MSLGSFRLENPTTAAEAVRLLGLPGAAPLAGGQDLLTEMKDHIRDPHVLVNLKHLPGISGIAHDPVKGLTIGALATLSDVAGSAVIRKHFRALAEAAESAASPQIRNVGTLGGNLCQRPRCWYYRNPEIHCLKKGGTTCYAAAGQNKYNAILGGGPSFIVHPSDTATALSALAASVEVQGPKGVRIVAIDRFFVLPTVHVTRENILLPGEIVTRILVPASAAGPKSSYLKFREKESMDWALSAAAVALEMHAGIVRQARIVLGGVAPIPWRAAGAEKLLRGRMLSDQLIAEAAEAALAGATPLEHNAYKIPLTKTMVCRALHAAAV